jgi:hypothetical protein
VATKPKRTPGEVIDRIHEMSLEDELARIDEMSDEEIEAEMKTLEDASGIKGDPAGTKRRLGAHIAGELKHQENLRKLQEEAARELTRALLAAAAAPKTPALPRKDLEARLDAALKRTPSLESPAQLAFHKRSREKASDEELRSFIDAFERLEAIARALDDKRRG